MTTRFEAGRGPRWPRAACAAATFALCALPGIALPQVAAESAAVRGATAGAVQGAAARGSSAGAAAGARVAKAAGAPAAAPAAAAPEAIPADTGPSCAGGLPEPTRVRMNAGKSTLINLPEPVTRRTLGDPEIVEGRMVSPQILYLSSGRIGTTNAILQGRSGRCVVLDIVVGIDTDAVQSKLAELLPNERGIRVSAAADSLVLSGTVSDAVAADRAVTIANAYVRTAYQQGFLKGGASPTQGLAAQPAIAGGAPLLARVVNLLSVGAPQQVMLEVKIAEVSKTLLDQLGVNFNASRTNGSFSYQILSNFLTGTANGVAGAVKNSVNNLVLEAQKQDGLVRVLAEPTVMAISGQEGSFLAGGKILIPVAQTNANGFPILALEEKEFGVGLKFTPTVLGDGRVNLRVSPEVSELSRTGVSLTAVGVSTGSVLPLITTRRASTTVQLYDGQSFAIGGLIKSSAAANLKAFPVLGEIPILGALFRSTDFQDERTEVVFIVTPRLVKPLPPDFQLPTDRVGTPSREDLFLRGQIDGPPPGGAPAQRQGAPGAPAARPGGGMELK